MNILNVYLLLCVIMYSNCELYIMYVYVFKLYYVLFDYCLEYFGVMFSFYKNNI